MEELQRKNRHIYRALKDAVDRVLEAKIVPKSEESSFVVPTTASGWFDALWKEIQDAKDSNLLSELVAYMLSHDDEKSAAFISLIKKREEISQWAQQAPYLSFVLFSNPRLFFLAVMIAHAQLETFLSIQTPKNVRKSLQYATSLAIADRLVKWLIDISGELPRTPKSLINPHIALALWNAGVRHNDLYYALIRTGQAHHLSPLPKGTLETLLYWFEPISREELNAVWKLGVRTERLLSTAIGWRYYAPVHEALTEGKKYSLAKALSQVIDEIDAYNLRSVLSLMNDVAILWAEHLSHPVRDTDVLKAMAELGPQSNVIRQQPTSSFFGKIVSYNDPLVIELYDRMGNNIALFAKERGVNLLGMVVTQGADRLIPYALQHSDPIKALSDVLHSGNLNAIHRLMTLHNYTTNELKEAITPILPQQQRAGLLIVIDALSPLSNQRSTTSEQDDDNRSSEESQDNSSSRESEDD